MARRVFYSFHYKPDVQRAHVVRNSWVTKPDRETAGFFDSSVFESKQRTSDDALKRFLNDGLTNSSVTCVLYGTETAWRRWVRYELVRSFTEGKGLLAIAIHSIPNFAKQTAAVGWNPLQCLGCEIKGGTVHFKERQLNGTWVWSPDIPSMPVANVRYNLRGATNLHFDALFPAYDWSQHQGYLNLGGWIEAAARAAGR